jgi:hypothetical protein
MATDLTVALEDRPGSLAELGEALGAAGINIDGVAGIQAGGQGLIHLLVEDGEAASGALRAAGFEPGEAREVLVVNCADRPGELGAVSRKVADAGVNVTLVYLATGTRLVLGVDDPEAARTALG